MVYGDFTLLIVYIQPPKYWSLHLWCLLILESNISEISNSISPLMVTGGGGVSVWFGNSLGEEGSNMEMWKTGWMPRMELGRRRVKEMEPTWARISKGPRNFSASFFDSRVVRILSDLMKTLSPILKSGGGVWHLSVDTEYRFCTSEMWEQSCRCSSSRSTA